MMIALLTLGAESRDVSSTKTCFGDAVTNAVIAAPIKLELLTWSSQKLVTRVAEILMREKLGYLDVSVRDYSGSGEDTSGYAYNRTASGEVSFNFELWPTLPQASWQTWSALTASIAFGSVLVSFQPSSFVTSALTRNTISPAWFDSSLSSLIGSQVHSTGMDALSSGSLSL